MGFFDKLKASVGVGGATITLDAPSLTTSNEAFRIDVTVRGGNTLQKLDAIDVNLTMSREETKDDGTTGSTTVTLFEERIDTTGKNVLQKGTEHRFERVIEGPALQLLFADPNDYVQLLFCDDEALHWNAEGPLPFAGPALPRLRLGVSADIPAAIDPSATSDLFVIPEAYRPPSADAPPGRMLRVGALSDAELASRLSRASLAWAFNGGDQWFMWWTCEQRTVAWANLKAVASVRPEGIVRTYTNPHVPKRSVLGKLASEVEERRDGDFEEAVAWARALAGEAKLTLLPRPIGNAVFALEDLHIVEGW